MKAVEGAAVEGLIRLSQRLWREFEIPEDRAAETPPPENLSKPAKAKPKPKSKRKRRQSEISEGRPTAEDCLARQKAIQSETPSNATSLDISKRIELKADSKAAESCHTAKQKLPPTPAEQEEQPSLFNKITQELQHKSCLIHAEIARFIAVNKRLEEDSMKCTWNECRIDKRKAKAGKKKGNMK
eukprot:TRINITY_DN6417_c0_g3_i2.p2 TRINITY_DN6417_c0_g3~~TRINITY_DN6417_c0_g3_i2.p2  ORF type:complete len:185 (+),score=33.84 TRINITY_DN6417_c0_g3_i2:453-1007(+)